MRNTLTRIIADAPGDWGVSIRELSPETHTLFRHRADLELRTASAAKVALLVAVSDAIDRSELTLDQPVSRGSVAPVHDSGLWQHLRQDALALDDVAKLVGTVSDNWATNALIATVGGVEAVAEGMQRHGVDGVGLHDIVRDARRALDPPTLSTGTADGYATLFAHLWERRNARVLGWLADGADLSMTASAFGLDPLAHSEPDRGVRIINKTGTDIGVRADCGVIERGDRAIAYACLVNWDASDPADPARDDVLAAMRAIGEVIRTRLAER